MGRSAEASTAFAKAKELGLQLGFSPSSLAENRPSWFNNAIADSANQIPTTKEEGKGRPLILSTTPAAWLNEGKALFAQGKLNESIQAYDKAIELNPSYAEAWLGIGDALNSQGKYDDAVKAYDKALELKHKM